MHAALNNTTSLSKDTLTTPYSHGLEKIYSFETVNPHTVKKLSSAAAPLEATKQTHHTKETEYSLPFETGFENALPSLRLYEPLESLGLSSLAYKALIKEGQKTVGDVLMLFQQGSALHKGIKQGHITEINEKVARLVGKNPLHPTSSFDILSLIKTTVYRIESKKRFLLLARCKLHNLFSITPQEQYELRSLSPSKHAEMYREALAECAYSSCEFLIPCLKKVGNAFFKKWLYQRHGFASEKELLYRLQMLSSRAAIPYDTHQHCVELIQKIIGTAPVFSYMLLCCSHMVYAADEAACKEYRSVRDHAASYFYHNTVSYPLSTLVHLLEKEFTKEWIGFPERFIEKVLRTDPKFLLFRKIDESIWVTLSAF